MTRAVPVAATIAELREFVRARRAAGERIGLVPTMGALHDGHLSLIETARQRAERVIATIFVNPTQFGANEDFSRYPRTFEADRARLAEVAADLVFAPSVADR
jgi:pantoate--beta-alanine ligase